MRTGRGLICGLGLAAAGLVVDAGVAQAQVTSADVGINPTYEQTDANTVVSTGGFFSARAFFTGTTDFTSGTLTYPGPASPEPLSYSFADIALEYGTSNSSFSALQSDFPTGDYTFDVTGGIEPTTIFTINYVGNTYALNPPELTAASYGALQGLNPADPLTLDFNSFITTGTPNNSDIVFSILNSSNDQVYTSGFLSPTATSVTIPGGALSPGQSYTFDLLFSEQVFGEVDASPGFGTTQFYDIAHGRFISPPLREWSPSPRPGRCSLSGLAGWAY